MYLMDKMYSIIIKLCINVNLHFTVLFYSFEDSYSTLNIFNIEEIFFCTTVARREFLECVCSYTSVSYTHLDVYKRQEQISLCV